MKVILFLLSLHSTTAQISLKYNLTERNLCNEVKALGFFQCEDVEVPEAHGWSGGWCLASMAEAGWLRSGSINPIMSVLLSTNAAEGLLPITTGSNSGGSMFAIRYFTLRNFPLATKWSYPCYLLHNPFKDVCYFHAGFGAISNECYSETFNVISLSASLVYGKLIEKYGGPMGVVSVYVGVYFPYISGLPLRSGEMVWSKFVKSYILFDKRYNLPSNWLVAHTLDSPAQAGQNPYNFGYDSYLARCTRAFILDKDKYSAPPAHNISVAWVCAGSANTQTGFAMAPFAIAGKSWDGLTAQSALSPLLKMFALLISYLMVKRLMSAHTLLTIKDSYTTFQGCKDGCPIMDGGFTDNAVLTPIISGSVKISPNRPAWISSIGASSTMATVKYLMGFGPLSIYTMAGVNVCPFTQGGLCTMISRVRELAVGTLPALSEQAYNDLGNAYQVFRPEVKLMTPYCGDPLSYDLFDGECNADSVCDMWAVIIPSTINLVTFTADVYVIVFVMAYIQSTPVSARFVKTYLPQAMWVMQYYEHMDQWFPDFDAISPSKGGIGFTNLAGNSFLDWMTYLNQRLVGYLFDTKKDAHELVRGTAPACYYDIYEMVAGQAYDEPTFLAKEAAGAKAR
jgi:hypothetical protein